MSQQLKFLTSKQVVAMHELQIDKFGGSHGLRDEGLLLSALAQPESGFGALAAAVFLQGKYCNHV